MAEAASSESGDCIENPPPERVETQLHIDQFSPIDMRLQRFALGGYLRTYWTDPRLAFNGSSEANGSCFNKLSFSHDQIAQIWKPEFYWEGAIDIELSHPSRGTGELLFVYPDGSIWWSRQVKITLRCPVNLDRMPFDTQTCPYMMGMYAYSAADVHLTWLAQQVAFANWQGACLSEWHATSFKQENVEQVYASANFTYASAEISFTRAPGAIFNTYFTLSIIFVGLSYLGFFIEPTSMPARVTLGMVCSLTVLVNLNALKETLPPMSRQPWMVRFMLGSFYFNVGAMVEQVATSFGLNMQAWLDTQVSALRETVPWKKSLMAHKEGVVRQFNEWDKDGDGELSKSEWRKGIFTLGFDAPQKEVDDFFDYLDVNDNGKLQLDELELLLNCFEKGAKQAEKKLAISQKLYDEVKERTNAQKKLSSTSAAAAPSSSSTPNLSTTPHPKVGVVLASDTVEDVARFTAVDVRVVSASRQFAQEQPVAMVAAAWEAHHVDDPHSSVAKSPISTNASVDWMQPAVKKLQRSATKALVGGIEKGKRLSITLTNGVALRDTRSELKKTYEKAATVDLDKGWWWTFKTFHLFPFMIARLRKLDHIARVVFPLAYIIYTLIQLIEVDFGRAQFDQLATAPCFSPGV